MPQVPSPSDPVGGNELFILSNAGHAKSDKEALKRCVNQMKNDIKHGMGVAEAFEKFLRRFVKPKQKEKAGDGK